MPVSVVVGPPGGGKTRLASGIGHKSLEAGYKVLFRTALDLVEDLELAEMQGELKRKISQSVHHLGDHAVQLPHQPFRAAGGVRRLGHVHLRQQIQPWAGQFWTGGFCPSGSVFSCR